MCITAEIENDKNEITVIDCSGLTQAEVETLSIADMFEVMLREGVGNAIAFNPKLVWVLTQEALQRCLVVQKSGLIEGNIANNARDMAIMQEMMGEDILLHHDSL